MKYWLRGFFNITLIDLRYNNLIDAQAKKQVLVEDSQRPVAGCPVLYCSLEIVEDHDGFIRKIPE